jgi:hypothetical protein
MNQNNSSIFKRITNKLDSLFNSVILGVHLNKT